jgi:CheY-like chemotaxis protein
VPADAATTVGQGQVIIALTGWGQPQDKQRALDAGFDGHLTKPVEMEALAAVLCGKPPGRQSTAIDGLTTSSTNLGAR